MFGSILSPTDFFRMKGACFNFKASYNNATLSSGLEQHRIVILCPLSLFMAVLTHFCVFITLTSSRHSEVIPLPLSG